MAGSQRGIGRLVKFDGVRWGVIGSPSLRRSCGCTDKQHKDGLCRITARQQYNVGVRPGIGCDDAIRYRGAIAERAGFRSDTGLRLGCEGQASDRFRPRAGDRITHKSSFSPTEDGMLRRRGQTGGVILIELVHAALDGGRRRTKTTHRRGRSQRASGICPGGPGALYSLVFKRRFVQSCAPDTGQEKGYSCATSRSQKGLG